MQPTQTLCWQRKEDQQYNIQHGTHTAAFCAWDRMSPIQLKWNTENHLLQKDREHTSQNTTGRQRRYWLRKPIWNITNRNWPNYTGVQIRGAQQYPLPRYDTSYIVCVVRKDSTLKAQLVTDHTFKKRGHSSLVSKCYTKPHLLVAL